MLELTTDQTMDIKIDGVVIKLKVPKRKKAREFVVKIQAAEVENDAEKSETLIDEFLISLGIPGNVLDELPGPQVRKLFDYFNEYVGK